MGSIYDTGRIANFYTDVELEVLLRQFEGKLKDAGDLTNPTNWTEWRPIINFGVPRKDKDARELESGRY